MWASPPPSALMVWEWSPLVVVLKWYSLPSKVLLSPIAPRSTPVFPVSPPLVTSHPNLSNGQLAPWECAPPVPVVPPWLWDGISLVEHRHGATSEIPSHSHSASCSTNGNHNHVVYGQNYGSGSGGIDTEQDEYHGHGMSYPTSYAGNHSHTITIGNTGGNSAHNNMPPYTVIYRWTRTA